MKELKDYIRNIENFPKEGIIFRDITSVLEDAKGLQLAMNTMMDKLKDVEFDVIVAPESRGFIFGVPIAYQLKKAFIPIRKKGKLPCETIEQSYTLEYGEAILEMHKNAPIQGKKVVIVDDLIGTGGTLEAIVKLVERLGGEIVQICCLIELPELEGRKKLKGYDVRSCISFLGK